MQKSIERDCKHHGLTTFVFEKRGAYRCRSCRSEAVMRRRRKIKSLLVEYKGGQCERCGYKQCIWALDFHHKDPAQKDFQLSSGKLTRSFQSYKQEVDKCMLVCANCHREIHEELKQTN